MRVLSVDDDPLFLEIISAELQALGYTDVAQATSAHGALRIVREATDPFDCFLLDIDMPDVDGVELCRMLRNEPTAQSIPAIMVTARTDMESVDRAFAVGATDYLTKPLNRRALRGRMQMVEQLAKDRYNRVLNARSGVELSEPLALTEAPRTISFLAMQNYLLKIGATRLANYSAVGIQIENIEDIYATRDPDAFRDTLLDVAEIIGESFKTQQSMITHAGFGDFVVLSQGIAIGDAEDLSDQLMAPLCELSNWYRSIGEISPRLRVGQPVRRRLFSFSRPDELLDAAIESAASSGIGVKEGAKSTPLPQRAKKMIA